MSVLPETSIVDLYAERWDIALTVAFLGLVALSLPYLRSLFVESNKPNENEFGYGLKYLKYLPRWISGHLYCHNALGLINAAVAESPNTPFRLPRLDIDINILPLSVVDELAGLPNEYASNILALQHDLVGQWTGLSMLQDVNLHLRIVQRRMTPNLGLLAADIEEEVNDVINSLFPIAVDGRWVELPLYHVMMRVAAQVFSRLVVGRRFCRHERWLAFATDFTENVFNSLVTIRYFPTWLHPVLKYTLPSVRKSIENIRDVEELLVPVFAELLQKDDGRDKDDPKESGLGQYAMEHDPLLWFTDIARGEERNPVKLVHSQILLALGAVHTSLFAEINLFYDLLSHPEYFEPLRDEIRLVVASGWDANAYSNLHKLDSVLRESQRMSPPFLTGLRRVMKQDYTFANGVSVRKGQYVCVPTFSSQNYNLDKNKPHVFDGFRSYNLKVKEGTFKSASHLFSTTESSLLAFGHGRTACPGRFLASVSLKMIFAKLIAGFDMQFAGNIQARPANHFAHEIVHPDPNVKIRVRRREDSFDPF